MRSPSIGSSSNRAFRTFHLLSLLVPSSRPRLIRVIHWNPHQANPGSFRFHQNISQSAIAACASSRRLTTRQSRATFSNIGVSKMAGASGPTILTDTIGIDNNYVGGSGTDLLSGG